MKKLTLKEVLLSSDFIEKMTDQYIKMLMNQPSWHMISKNIESKANTPAIDFAKDFIKDKAQKDPYYFTDNTLDQLISDITTKALMTTEAPLR